jgi:hypothetical protein
MSITIQPAPRRAARHIIADVRFQQTAERGLPMEQAPLLCECGEVTTSGDWNRHRGVMDHAEASALGGRARKGAA